MHFKNLFFGAALCALSLAPLPALADKGGNGHGRGSDDHQERRYNDDDDSNYYYERNRAPVIIIGSEDRTYIRNYIVEDYHRHCPPGLAKKHNGCLPPGQAKKRYEIGRPLPADVVFVPVSLDLRRHLAPVPSGYQYVQVDKDVLLIAEASHKVIDAVTLLSAVGN